MKRFLPIILYFTFFSLAAQTIIILDEESKFPIANVAVFNENQSKQKVSDKNGKINLSDFNDNEILTFKHFSYVEFEILKRQLTSDKIYLRSTSHHLKEVFLSTSKSKETRKRIAEQIAVFSIQDIQRLSPQTSADMLAEIPGIKGTEIAVWRW